MEATKFQIICEYCDNLINKLNAIENQKYEEAAVCRDIERMLTHVHHDIDFFTEATIMFGDDWTKNRKGKFEIRLRKNKIKKILK